MDFEELTRDTKVQLSKNPRTPPETLALLADDKVWLVRNYVATNPNTPPETLDRLADGSSYFVARNPNTPPATLERLVDNDKLKNVHYWVTQNPNTPEYVKEYLTAMEFYIKSKDLTI